MSARVIAHYRLIDPLGEGGMGIVYRAEDLRLGREVAIKLLRTDAGTSAEWLGRFEREARLASSLQHPHICTIHELGEYEGQPFIAMELLEGVTVRALLEDGAMRPERVLAFARQIAEALDAAHRRGIIHRDIKPANLFVTYADHLKILDFGLAKTTSLELPSTGTAPIADSKSTAPSDIDLTRTGVTVGTASYMSPEQAVGWPLDARTDLFSLGSVLYEMATGRRAFGGETVAAVLKKIVNGIVVPPRAVKTDIPPALEGIIQKLMAVDATRRYQTAADLLADVRAARLQLEPATAAGVDTGVTLTRVASKRRRRWRSAAPAAIVAVAALAGIGRIAWRPGSSPMLGEHDSIVIGTLENNTGNAMFDEALIAALKLQLGQSPFLDVVGDQVIRDTLRLMGRKSDERLTHEVARDACQRVGAKAMLDGSIATLGSHYVVTLVATDCNTGESFARAQGQATDTEHVLTELGNVTKQMRTALGESLPAIRRFDAPIEEATTPSLAALKAYALGLEERRHGRELESVAFFNQAIELDRDFAAAYAMLSTVYGSLGEWRRSEEYATLAYGMRKRVSERERLLIEYQYHDRVTRNEDRAVETLQLWKSSYPRDSRPPNALALIYNRMGRYAEAEAEAREALRRSPGHPFPLSNLAFAYRSMGQDAEARKVAEEAVKLGVETSPTRRLLYQLGVAAGDGSEAPHVAWAASRPREFDLVAAEAQVAAFGGRMQSATELYLRAADIATARGLNGTASGHMAHLALTEALYAAPGRGAERVRRFVEPAPADGDANVPPFRTAVALALVGLTGEAQALTRLAVQRYPQGTFVRTVFAPAAGAAIALRQQKPDAAIDLLRAAAPTELGTVAGLVPTYLRGEAFRQAGRPLDAGREYEKLLSHRSVEPFAPVIPMAQLGLARARAHGGDLDGSRRAYEELFGIWRNADPRFYPLAAARAEYDALARRRTARPPQGP